jgi:phosphoglycerol transferase
VPWYALLTVSTLVLLGVIYSFDQIGLHIPLVYVGDGLAAAESVKTILETGWYLFNPNVGAPFGQYMAAYPNSDGFSFLLIKIIGIFTDDWAVAMNVFYFLTYILAALASFWAMRKMGVHAGVAYIFSLLYAFLPFHLMRSENHLYLAAYYAAPLVIFVVYTALSFEYSDKAKPQPNIWLLILIGIVASSSGAYYAFFSCAVLFFALIYQIIQLRNFSSSKPVLILLGIIIVGGVVNVSPTLVYLLTHPHPTLTWRGPAEAEIYGLKIAQLLLPRPGGSFHFWSFLSEKYCKVMPLVNENRTASLGIWGSIGFLFGLGALTFIRQKKWVEPIRSLARVNLFMVLLATIGGFSSLIFLLGFTEIRGYNRISNFIAFISLFSIAAVFTHLLKKLKQGWKSKILVLVILLMALLVGLKDQVNFPEINAASLQQPFMTDKAYFSSLQKMIPKQAIILQLPYVPFPEYPPVVKMTPYDQFRPYLHTRGIRWSYGVMKGTQEDEVIRTLSSLSPQDIVKKAHIVGYSGVLINTLGYKDAGADIIKEFQTALGQSGISGAGFVYFSLPLSEPNEGSQVRGNDQLLFALKRSAIKILPGEVKTFQSQNNQYLTSGFSLPEPWGVWSEASISNMTFFIEQPKSNVILVFKVSPYLPKPGMVLSVAVKANGTKVTNWTFKNGGAYPTDVMVDVPQSLVPPDGKLNLTFEYSKTNSPAGLGISADPRQLALGFISVTRSLSDLR